MHSTPVSLILRLREPGDAASWDRFVELFAPLLRGWARRLGARDADADDLVQDVFVALVRQLPGFDYDPAKSFRAWLWTILYRTWQRRKPQPAALPDAGADLEARPSRPRTRPTTGPRWWAGRCA